MTGTHIAHAALLAAEAGVAAALLMALYAMRTRFGTAVLFVGVGAFQFLQVVASVTLYVEIAPGVVVSPGSSVLFASNVFAVLLLYMDSPADARRLIYGLVFANTMLALFAWLMHGHTVIGAQSDAPTELLARNPRVLLVGTVVLYLDCVLAVLVFEWISVRVRGARRWLGVRVFLTMALVLAFDSVVFLVGAFAPMPGLGSLILSGAVGKWLAAAVLAMALAAYARWGDATSQQTGTSLAARDLFGLVSLAREAEHYRAGEERLDRAARSARDGLFDWDLETDVVFFTDQWLDMVGAEGAANRQPPSFWLDRVDERDRGELDAAITRHRRGHTESIEVEYRIGIGAEARWMECRAVVERDVTGRPVRLAGSQVDVTRRRNAEAAKDEFVSMVSHELRTPLTSVHGALRLVLGGAGGELSEKHRSILGIAERNSARLRRLIDDLLEVQRFAREDLAMEVEPVQLDAIVRDEVEAAGEFATAAGVELELGSLPTIEVRGDRLRLGQVLANLVSNAAKFSPEGSTVLVEIVDLETRARVQVHDRGPGLPDAFKERAFDTFAQGEVGLKRQFSGSGLGLSIARKIIDAHGGAIGFEDRPGGGTTFWFELRVE